MKGLVRTAMDMEVGSAAPARPNVREQLLGIKAALEVRIKEINEAVEALDKNPEFEKLHNLLNGIF